MKISCTNCNSADAESFFSVRGKWWNRPGMDVIEDGEYALCGCCYLASHDTIHQDLREGKATRLTREEYLVFEVMDS